MAEQDVSYLPDEQSILAYTHNKRTELITEITKDGAPKDNDSQKVLLSALKDMDSSALSRLRIAVEVKNSANNAQNAEIITEILKRTNSNMFMAVNCNREIPVLPESIPTPALVPGELSTVIETETIDEFMKKFDIDGDDQ